MIRSAIAITPRPFHSSGRGNPVQSDPGTGNAINFEDGASYAIRERTWHDIVADSLVVSANVYPPGEFGRPAS